MSSIRSTSPISRRSCRGRPAGIAPPSAVALTRFPLSRYGWIVLKPFPPPVGPSPLPGEGQLAAWARGAAALDRQSTRLLLLTIGPIMLRIIRRVLGPSASEAEDVLQDAAQGLLGALASFKGECTVLHFACRVAVFSALACRRKVSFRAQWMVDDPDASDGAPSGELSPADSLLAARRREVLEMLLDELPPPQAEVLILHCALDFRIDEIAAAVGRPGETIRSRLRLAKRALRERIGGSAELTEILEMKP
jgi:RNA polymerase sigma factor (sigma-70 family)